MPPTQFTRFVALCLHSQPTFAPPPGVRLHPHSSRLIPGDQTLSTGSVLTGVSRGSQPSILYVLLLLSHRNGARTEFCYLHLSRSHSAFCHIFAHSATAISFVRVDSRLNLAKPVSGQPVLPPPSPAASRDSAARAARERHAAVHWAGADTWDRSGHRELSFDQSYRSGRSAFRPD